MQWHFKSARKVTARQSNTHLTDINTVVQVTGWIEERGKKQEYPKLSGDWNTYLCVEESDKKQRELWRVHPPGSPNIFDMTVFAISLTDRPPALMAKLPPTDSRRREDIHLLEQCIFDRVSI